MLKVKEISVPDALKKMGIGAVLIDDKLSSRFKSQARTESVGDC